MDFLDRKWDFSEQITGFTLVSRFCRFSLGFLLRHIPIFSLNRDQALIFKAAHDCISDINEIMNKSCGNM